MMRREDGSALRSVMRRVPYRLRRKAAMSRESSTGAKQREGGPEPGMAQRGILAAKGRELSGLQRFYRRHAGTEAFVQCNHNLTGLEVIHIFKRSDDRWHTGNDKRSGKARHAFDRRIV